jgi:hypothetical protein
MPPNCSLDDIDLSALKVSGNCASISFTIRNNNRCGRDFFLSCAVVRSEKKENDESAEKKRYSRTSVRICFVYRGFSSDVQLIFAIRHES